MHQGISHWNSKAYTIIRKVAMFSGTFQKMNPVAMKGIQNQMIVEQM